MGLHGEWNMNILQQTDQIWFQYNWGLCGEYG